MAEAAGVSRTRWIRKAAGDSLRRPPSASTAPSGSADSTHSSTSNADAVLAQARAVDARRKAASRCGPLAGVPVAIKDVLCVEGEPTTCGSRMLSGLPAALRRHRDRPAQGGRRGPVRQDEHGRVRHGLVDREQRLRPDPQSRGTRSAFRAARRGARPRPSPPDLTPHGPRHRHRRLDPIARRDLRDRRPEADVRPRQPLRPDRLSQLARSGRPLRA